MEVVRFSGTIGIGVAVNDAAGGTTTGVNVGWEWDGGTAIGVKVGASCGIDVTTRGLGEST